MVAGRPPRSFCTGPLPFECGSTDAHPKPQNEGYKLPSFVNNLVSPFMSCWQPPINACGTPQRRGSQGPPSAAVVSPHPASPPQATTNIREPHSNDVLCGRGGSSNRHVGNLNFRSLVAANKDMYVTLTKKQKMMVARKIVEAVQIQDPPGRFLQKDAVTGLWFDIGLPRSLEKTSQALREKTPGSKETIDAPVSPGGSSVTVTTVESLSDAGVEMPVLAKSPPSSPTPDTSTGPPSPPPVQSSIGKSALSPNEVPDITIPEHLESQFRPRRHKDPRPGRLPRHGHPPYPYHPYPYPHHPPLPPQQPYMHPYPPDPRHDYYHRPHGHPPPPHYPYPPPMPMIGERPPYPHARPQYVPSSPHPPSPDRREYHMRDHRQLPSPKTPPTRQQQVPSPMGSGTPPRQPLIHPETPVHSNTSNQSNKSTGAIGRQTGEVSPGRAQVSKKRRTAADEALTRDMANRLSLHERTTSSSSSSSSPQEGELKSPSNVLQSRVRRGMEPTIMSSNSSYPVSPSPRRISSESRNRGDALAGLAALSSAALLKLDEENK